MRSNTKVRYGLRTMIQIALDNKEGIYQKDISKKQDISVKYLDQIIAALKAEGLITRPPDERQGYVLTRPASEISVYDIYKAFEPALNVVPCLPEEGICKRKSHCAAVHFWSGLNNHLRTYFEDSSLDALVQIQEQHNKQQIEK